MIQDTAAQGIDSFAVFTPTNTLSSLVLNQTVDAAITVPGGSDVFQFTLGATTRVYLDHLAGRYEIVWTLDGPAGRVGSGDTMTDFGVVTLAPGDYRLTFSAQNHITSPYRFRLLDLRNVDAITFGATTTVTNIVPGSTTFYRFNAATADRLYFDFLNRLVSGSTPGWRLYDPYDNRLFDQSITSDVGPYSLPNSGQFLLGISDNNATLAPGTYQSFRVVNSPVTPPDNILRPASAADLVVREIAVSPASGIQSGSSIQVSWKDSNAGASPTAGSWTDRVSVRNPSTSQVVGTVTVLYDESAPGAGPVLPGETRNRTAQITLPEGPSGAGSLEVIVTADSGNAIAEQNADGTGESNNSGSAGFSSALPGYPDLQVSRVAVSPTPGWSAGSVVTVAWQVTNAGPRTVSASWKDSVQVRNITSGGLLTNALISYNPVGAGNAPLAQGGTVDRQLELAIPNDGDTHGIFEITVNTDSADEIYEYIAAYDAKTNNQSVLRVASAPDLQVESLVVLTPGQSGADLVIQWNDVNRGNTEVARAFYDGVIVRNPSLNDTLASVSVYYNPNAAGLAPIPVNGSRTRQQTIRLPDGPRGSGQLEVSVITDSGNGIVELSGLSPAETNNTAVVTTTATLSPYPDLVARNLSLSPASIQSGAELTLRWEDANLGATPTSGGWSDRIQVLNVTRGSMLLDTSLYYDPNSQGPITNGTFRARQYVLRLPNGDPGVGNLRVTITADGSDNVFEYLPGTDAQANNSVSLERSSGLAPYPDLQVVGLAITPASLSSGREITLTWRNTNSGVGTVTGDFYDLVRIVNRTTSQTLLNTSVYLNPSADTNGPILPGQTRDRRFSFRLPDGAAGAGDLEFQIGTDDGNRVFEYLSGGDGETNNLATLTRSSIAGSYPDLVLTSVTAPATGIPGQSLNLLWSIRNDGAVAPSGTWNDQVFLSDDAVIGNDQLLGSFPISAAIAPGQSLSITQSIQVPFFLTGSQRFIVRVNAGQSFYEPSFANNILMDDQAISLPTRLDLASSRTQFPENAGAGAATITVSRNSDTAGPR